MDSNNKNQNVKSENKDPENQNEDKGVVGYISQANHPLICIITILFKLSSLTCFILLSLLVDSTALIYLLVILLASFDFWMTKNVSGRKLVGLRWWNEVKEDGTEVWIFESKNEVKESNADTRIFWLCVYLSTAAWTIIFIWDIISFKWIWAIIALVCLVFSGTNLYGFFKCSKKQQESISKLSAKAVVTVAEKGIEYGKK
jgi:hypothetical protein